jgi:hypothetical protein
MAEQRLSSLTAAELAALKADHEKTFDHYGAGHDGPACQIDNEPSPCRVRRLIDMYEQLKPT